MIGERTRSGLEIRLRPQGVGRYFGAAFLLAWLCAWAVGEGFALNLLVRGAPSLAEGARGPFPLAPGGLFLLLWLAFWTLGGAAAIASLFELVWGEDRLTLDGAGLTVVRARGPFRSSRTFARDAVRGATTIQRGRTIALETGGRAVPLTSYGTPAERDEVLAAIHRELGLGPVADAEHPALPPGWEDLVTPEGDRVLVGSPAARHRQASVLVALAFVTGALFAVCVRGTIADPSLLPGAIVTLVLTAALGAIATWLAKGRMEWKIGNGRLVQRRRFGADVRDTFEGTRLELGTHRDNDGDEWFTLEATGAGIAAATVATPAASFGAAASTAMLRGGSPNRRVIVSVMSDPTVPRRLGEWLARAAGVPLEDRTTRKAQEAELATLLETLAQSGRAGRFAASLLAPVAGRTKKSA